jgi:hypothetical protein
MFICLPAAMLRFEFATGMNPTTSFLIRSCQSDELDLPRRQARPPSNGAVKCIENCVDRNGGPPAGVVVAVAAAVEN